ncbi:MAG: hypothetical protein Udaeo_07430 [Candidatus Udaeobacter sp.]|nr:MAG: hypothetical protein Udaeo_07430 [Candidatus Udaeobacter sp.]
MLYDLLATGSGTSIIDFKIGIANFLNMGWSSRGGPGRTKTCGDGMRGLMFAFK